MIHIRNITEQSSDEEVLENLSGRVEALKRLLFVDGTTQVSGLQNASVVRLIQIHLEGLEKEIDILKERGR